MKMVTGEEAEAAEDDLGTETGIIIAAIGKRMVAVVMTDTTITMATVKRRNAVGRIEIVIGKGREEGRGNDGPTITTTLGEETGAPAEHGVDRAVAMIPTTVVIAVELLVIGAEPGAAAAAEMSEGHLWQRRRHRAAMPAAMVDGASVAMVMASRERMLLEWAVLPMAMAVQSPVPAAVGWTIIAIHRATIRLIPCPRTIRAINHLNLSPARGALASMTLNVLLAAEDGADAHDPDLRRPLATIGAGITLANEMVVVAVEAAILRGRGAGLPDLAVPVESEVVMRRQGPPSLRWFTIVVSKILIDDVGIAFDGS